MVAMSLMMDAIMEICKKTRVLPSISIEDGFVSTAAKVHLEKFWILLLHWSVSTCSEGALAEVLDRFAALERSLRQANTVLQAPEGHFRRRQGVLPALEWRFRRLYAVLLALEWRFGRLDRFR